MISHLIQIIFLRTIFSIVWEFTFLSRILNYFTCMFKLFLAFNNLLDVWESFESFEILWSFLWAFVNVIESIAALIPVIEEIVIIRISSLFFHIFSDDFPNFLSLHLSVFDKVLFDFFKKILIVCSSIYLLSAVLHKLN